MLLPRLIPCLLLDGHRFVKTQRFTKAAYIGDPFNTIKIFNEKCVDEVIILDIRASKTGVAPDFKYIESLARECFMPLCYGGGVQTLDDANRLIAGGVEKVALNTASFESPGLISEIASRYGSQSVVVGIDVKKNWLNSYRVLNSSRSNLTSHNPIAWAKRMADAGAGEILLNNADRDGTLLGYDLSLVKSITNAVTIPITVCGGASSLENCKAVVEIGGAAAAAAGALFVYKGPHRAVLINYPAPQQLQELFK